MICHDKFTKNPKHAKSSPVRETYIELLHLASTSWGMICLNKHVGSAQPNLGKAKSRPEEASKITQQTGLGRSDKWDISLQIYESPFG